MPCRRIYACLFALAVAGQLPAAVIGQIDTFKDGTTMGWFVPGATPNPPSNVATGGPAGAGDAYLRLVAIGGSVPGGRLSVLNSSQWAGDYTAAGITHIRLDANNFGPEDLFLRLLFEDFDGPGPPVNLALTSNAAFVPSGSGWTSVEFAITSAELTALIGTAGASLLSTDTIRIFHNPDPDFPGPGVGIPPVSATLGVDNITAVGVPEPGTLSLMVGAFVMLIACGRRVPRAVSASRSESR